MPNIHKALGPPRKLKILDRSVSILYPIVLISQILGIQLHATILSFKCHAF